MQTLFRHHLMFTIMCVVCFINAVFFLAVGVYKTIEGYAMLYKSIFAHEWAYPGRYIAEALDSFMLSLLFVIFGMGIYRLFIKPDMEDDKFPRWLNIHTISDLKFLLWETILVTLIVFSVLRLSTVVEFTWNELIPPGIVLILSFSYFLVAREKH
jgi:uncharacterized membrane protein YqhA